MALSMLKKKRPLDSLTAEEYKLLLDSGMLWEIYPEAAGNYITEEEK